MTNEPEYSQQIQWFDWPAEWRLDRDDEEQLQRDIDETKSIIKYVQNKKELINNGTKSSSTKVTQQKRNLRRSSIRKRQDPLG